MGRRYRPSRKVLMFDLREIRDGTVVLGRHVGEVPPTLALHVRGDCGRSATRQRLVGT